MKLFKYIALSSVLALSMASCDDWLDVNVNPDTPTNESIAIQNRLPWILKQVTYSTGCAGTRTFATCGGFYTTNGNMNAVSVTWAGANGLCTTPYQTFFVGVGPNLGDLYKKAEKEGAYHYMAVVDVIKAIGFMEMADIYGEMPYEEALGSSVAPVYNNGKEIYYGCMDMLNEAIELFGREQDGNAQPLSAGDIWNGGDVQKWLKLCYGLKARWLMRITKKAEWNADEVLAALAKAPQSNNDNTIMACFDVLGDQTDFLLGDPIYTNGTWDTAAYGKTQWFSKYHYDLLANMRGAGVEDPRLPKIVPACMTEMKLDASGKVIDYKWRRGIGVDIFGDAERLVAGGATSIAVQKFAQEATTMSYKIEDAAKREAFIAGLKTNKAEVDKSVKDEDMAGATYKVDEATVTVCYPAGAWYVNSSNYVQAGDTIYVNLNGASVNTNNGTWGIDAKNCFYYGNDQYGAVAGAVSGTGSFQIRAMSDYDVVTYYEMCFIKAEALYRKGDKGGALTAYKEGIKAHMERMQTKLRQWKSEGYTNPDMWPMDDAAISSYLSSAAVCQSSGDLKMSDIMLQKYVAMGFNTENWVDMRRFNYSNNGDYGVVYPGYGRTKLFAGDGAMFTKDPGQLTSWIRRWRQCSHEFSYNQTNLLAIQPNALEPFIWSLPCWFDCATDAEYESYLKAL